MRKTLLYIFLVWIVTACSSRDRQWFSMAEQAESPEEKLEYLDTINFPLELLPEEKAYYGFLLTQSHILLGKSCAEDSLILFSLDYYEKNPRPDVFPEVYKLCAEYYRWNEDSSMQLAMLQKGMDSAIQQADSVEAGNFSRLLGSYFFNRKENRSALDYYQKSLLYQKGKNFDNYYVMGLIYSRMNEMDSCYYFIQKAIDLSRESNAYYWTAQYLRNYGGLLKKEGLYEKALEKIRETESLSDYYIGYSPIELMKAEIFLKRDQLDSAQYHLDIAKQNTHKSNFGMYFEDLNSDPGTENEIARLQGLIDFTLSKRIDSQAISQFNDSIFNKIRFHQRLIAGKQEAQLRNDRQQFNWVIRQQRMKSLLISGVLICIILSGITFFWIKRRREQLIEAEEQIEALKGLLDDVRKENGNDKNQNQNTFFKRTLLKQLGIIKLVANTPTEQNRILLRNISELSGYPLPADSLLMWDDLYPVIDSLYNNFYTRLAELYGQVLTDKEIQLCCLMRAEFGTKEISVVTRQSIPTIYQRKTTIRKKLGMDEKEDIIEFIRTRFDTDR